MKLLVLTVASALTLTSCSNSTSDKTTANTTTAVSKKTSKELNQDFDNAWNAKDSTKLISLLAENVEMLAGASHFTGKQELTDKFIRKNLPVASNLKTVVVSSGEDDNIAYEAGTFSLDVNLPDKGSFVNKGNYNFVWKKGSDDAWKVASINMEDLPLEKANR